MVSLGGADRPFLMSLWRWPRHLEIKGEHQGRTLGRPGAGHEVGCEAAVTHHIELEPERLVVVPGHLLD